MSEWIPVNERLPEFEFGEKGAAPETSADVLVYWPDREIGVAYYNAPDDWYDQTRDQWSDCAPTHWMSLPEPPK